LKKFSYLFNFSNLIHCDCITFNDTILCEDLFDAYVDEYRNMISDFSGLPLFDENCSFYYDETGNVRKFRLTENGVNAEEGIANDFILGGVLFKGDTPPCDVDRLFDELRIVFGTMKTERSGT
jgi:hypothetical protein